MTIRLLVDDVLALDQLAWIQLLSVCTAIVVAARLFFWLCRSLLVNGDVVLEAEQIVHTSETAASFNHDFIPTAAHVAIAEAKALPRIHEGLTS